MTTGQTNTTVWAGIHHKTNMYGGTSSFGYPDATYLNRVTNELADRGVIVGDPSIDQETAFVQFPGSLRVG